jgi:uncharacterized protein involved in response to NO
MAVPRTRPYSGPALFSYSFRPFFLFGALYAGLIVPVWLLILAGRFDTASSFAPVDWHSHELMFGYLAAVLAGFLFTAIPNWTGRLPLNGLPLASLVTVWAAGRAAVFWSELTGPVAATLVDCAFLTLILAAATREIVAGQNWRNLMVLAPVSIFLCANILFHGEAALLGQADVARRLGLGAAIMLIAIVGGRIIPSFTRNWLAKRRPGPLPAPFDRLDAFALALSAIALTGWVFAPEQPLCGWILLIAGLVNLVRLVRWRGDRTVADPLVFVLHLGFLWLPVGFIAAGLATLYPDFVSPAVAAHAFGVGAIGTMTLAVMVRATLGHTGQPLEAGWRGLFIFAAISLAALARVLHALGIHDQILLHVSATCWTAAFLGFVLMFGRALMSPRRS